MADPVFRSFSSVASSGTTIVIPKPTGTIDDDLMFCDITAAASGSISPTITTLSGWTLIGTHTRTDAGYAYRTSFYYKIAASEGADYTWTMTSNVGNHGNIHTYDNCNTASPLDTYSTNNFDGTATPTATAITLAEINELVIAFFAGTGTVDTWTAPSGMTERSDDGSIEISDYVQALSGTTGGKQATASASGNGYCGLFAFRSQDQIIGSGLLELAISTPLSTLVAGAISLASGLLEVATSIGGSILAYNILNSGSNEVTVNNPDSILIPGNSNAATGLNQVDVSTPIAYAVIDGGTLQSPRPTRNRLGKIIHWRR